MKNVWLSSLVVLALSACENNSNDASSPSGAAGSGSGASGAAGALVAGGAGGAGAEGDACEGVRVDHVAGQFLDIHGQPPASRSFTVCGSACVKGDMREDGSFLFDKKYCFLTDGLLPRPVLIYHGLDKNSDMYIDFIPQNAREVTMTFPAPFYVVPVAEMAKITIDPASAQTLTDGMGFELSYDAGGVDPGFAESLAVREVPKDKWPNLQGIDKLVALYALHPSEVTFLTPARVKFPNTANLPPGSVVHIDVIGSVIGALPYPGTLGQVASGRVTDDGTAIVSDEGSGLPNASWVGYRVAPP